MNELYQASQTTGPVIEASARTRGEAISGREFADNLGSNPDGAPDSGFGIYSDADIEAFLDAEERLPEPRTRRQAAADSWGDTTDDPVGGELNIEYDGDVAAFLTAEERQAASRTRQEAAHEAWDDTGSRDADDPGSFSSDPAECDGDVAAFLATEERLPEPRTRQEAAGATWDDADSGPVPCAEGASSGQPGSDTASPARNRQRDGTPGPYASETGAAAGWGTSSGRETADSTEGYSSPKHEIGFGGSSSDADAGAMAAVEERGREQPRTGEVPQIPSTERLPQPQHDPHPETEVTGAPQTDDRGDRQSGQAQHPEPTQHGEEDRLAEAGVAAPQELRSEQALTDKSAPTPEIYKSQVAEHDANKAAATFLLLCDDYSPKKGGVVVFNKALAEGLADAGQDVIVRIGEDASPYADEQRPNLSIVGPKDLPENPDSRKLLGAGSDPEDMPEHVDYVVGHTRFSGPDAKATRDAKYPDAKLIHFVHMVPKALGRVKEDTERGQAAKGIENHAIERNLVADADLAVGVGPAITEDVRKMVRQARENAGQTEKQVATQAVHELIPGMDFRDRMERSTEGRPLNVFIFGRTDVGQKGAKEAAQVVGRLREVGLPVRLVVRGVPGELVEEQQLILSEIVGDTVEVRPFTVERSDLLADLDDADVMVMTSRAEGFGLTAHEAAAAGIPVVVPSSSGFGRWLGESGQFSPELTGPSIVPQGFEDQVPTDLWFDALRTVVEDYPAAQQRALDLQQEFKDRNVSWESAVKSLMEKARGLQ